MTHRLGDRETDRQVRQGDRETDTCMLNHAHTHTHTHTLHSLTHTNTRAGHMDVFVLVRDCVTTM